MKRNLLPSVVTNMAFVLAASLYKLVAWRKLLLLLLGGLAVSAANAQRPDNVTAGELAMLPVYCPDTQGFNYDYTNKSPKAAYWVSLMGESFWHFHHHCWALLKIQRGMRPGVSAEQRTGAIKSAMGDFDYVTRNAAPNFIMLPEVYLKMGEAYLLLKNYGMAQESFNQARLRKPDFAPPYLRWADTLEGMGRKKAALEHIEEGLKAAPNSPELRAKYKHLGGTDEKFLSRPMPAADSGATADKARAAANPASAATPATAPASPEVAPAASAASN